MSEERKIKTKANIWSGRLTFYHCWDVRKMKKRDS